MTFIKTIEPEGAPAAVADLYASDRAVFGDLPNFTRVFSLRPEVYGAWRGLNGAIKSGMDLRRYEIVTFAAARRLHSSYCMLAHGTVLANQSLDPETVAVAAADHRAAGLEEIDVAIMDLADKVACDATSVTQADVDHLRRSDSPTRRSSTLCLRRRHVASSARCATASAPKPIPSTRR